MHMQIQEKSKRQSDKGKEKQQTGTQIHQCTMTGHEYSLCPDNLVLDNEEEVGRVMDR